VNLFLPALLFAVAVSPLQSSPGKRYGTPVAQLCRKPTPDFAKRRAQLLAKGVDLCGKPRQALAAVRALRAREGFPKMPKHSVRAPAPKRLRKITVAQFKTTHPAWHFVPVTQHYHGNPVLRKACTNCASSVRSGLRVQLHVPILPYTVATPAPPAISSINDGIASVDGWGDDLIVGADLYLPGQTPSVYLTIACANGTVGAYGTVTQEGQTTGGQALWVSFPQIPVPVASTIYSSNGPPSVPAQIVVNNGVNQSAPVDVSYAVNLAQVDLTTVVTDKPSDSPSGTYLPGFLDPNFSPGNIYLADRHDYRNGIVFGGSGTDQIGIGASLVNGYQYRNVSDPFDYPNVWLSSLDTLADNQSTYYWDWGCVQQQMAAHAYLCSGFTAQPDSSSSYGARIANNPSGSSLQTGVRWYYNGGHGIAYSLDWPLYGPVGLRPLNTMPFQQGGVCEQ